MQCTYQIWYLNLDRLVSPKKTNHLVCSYSMCEWKTGEQRAAPWGEELVRTPGNRWTESSRQPQPTRWLREKRRGGGGGRWERHRDVGWLFIILLRMRRLAGAVRPARRCRTCGTAPRSGGRCLVSRPHLYPLNLKHAVRIWSPCVK
jgi:hypothetical protein